MASSSTFSFSNRKSSSSMLPSSADHKSSHIATSQQKAVVEEDPAGVEMDLMVQDLLEQMQTKFKVMGDNILGRMEHMNRRMDHLEASIGELLHEAGLEPSGGGRILSSAITPSTVMKPQSGKSVDRVEL